MTIIFHGGHHDDSTIIMMTPHHEKITLNNTEKTLWLSQRRIQGLFIKKKRFRSFSVLSEFPRKKIHFQV